jgi:hypothetical protein
MSLNIISIGELGLEVEHDKIHIKYEEDDDLDLHKVRIFKSNFSNLGLKKAKFNSCSINNSLFKDCYLRYATFNNVDLTGSKFINCDLTNVKLNSCNIRYVEFRNCTLNLNEVLGCLPQETNLKIQLLKELRLNQISIGDNKGADEILIKILDSEKKLLMERVRCETSYHHEREDFFSRIKAYFGYILLFLNDIIWGYGLRITRLFRAALFIIISFGVIIYICTDADYITATVTGNESRELSFGDSLYVSYTNFITVGYGNYIPNTSITKWIFIVENTLGYIFLGFLVSGVYRRIAK